ncbi:MAG: glutamine--tRNA ligase/YqeY domain fusion protein [Gemmatimonadota bacterium]|nr:glutamine--tRNA ligase/YqeY domain fusion protein [Gemmatimonadota bacterium]
MATVNPSADSALTRPQGLDFVRTMVDSDQRSDKYGGRVETRFPPEPNGYLHIGHAKSICLNFGLAEEYDGICHVRFDDTNPETEEMKYVDAIQTDIRWLGFDWGEHLYFASDYFEQLFEFAELLIFEGKAYVDSLNAEEIREYRGTVKEPGRNSPYRDRSIEENIDLFHRMRAGDFPDGSHVLRAKIDMAHPNMVMRDPVLYRIRHASHYRTGDDWCIYPLYDFTHCLSDAIENITHSLCTLEFKDNREIYDWVLDGAGFERPRTQQTESARLNLDYTVLSKRKLIQLVEQNYVDGWDDPRMPTIAGLRRRGVPPEAIRRFCDLIGVAKVDSRVDYDKLEFCIRDELNLKVQRVMAVLRPLKVVIENFPEGKVETMQAPYYPKDVPLEGTRPVPFTREIFIEQDDFQEEPEAGFFRLAPGREVRLRYAYVIRCTEVVRDSKTGAVTELRCTYDPKTKGGNTPDGRKVKGTLHWVSASEGIVAEVRIYDRLFSVPDPEDVAEGELFTKNLNPGSKMILHDAVVEPSLKDGSPGERYQFERQGYFVSDCVDSSKKKLVFNRTVTLRDTWAKVAGAGQAPTKNKALQNRKTDQDGKVKPKQTVPKVERVRSRSLMDKSTSWIERFGLKAEDADVVTADDAVARLFEETIAVAPDGKTVAQWIANEIPRTVRDEGIDRSRITGKSLGALIQLVSAGTISRTIAKEILAELIEKGGDPNQIVEERGLAKVGDTDLIDQMVAQVLAENPGKVADYKNGKVGLFGFFVGQAMQKSGGRADPVEVKKIVEQRLT